jgi:hypothetical protein
MPNPTYKVLIGSRFKVQRLQPRDTDRIVLAVLIARRLFVLVVVLVLVPRLFLLVVVLAESYSSSFSY